jgi:hypothetical protein
MQALREAPKKQPLDGMLAGAGITTRIQERNTIRQADKVEGSPEGYLIGFSGVSAQGFGFHS